MRRERKSKNRAFAAACQTHRWRRAPALIIALLMMIVISSCASQGKRISTRQTEMDNLRRELRYLKQQNAQLRREIDEMNKKLQEMQFLNKQDKADMAARLDEALRQMETIENQLQDTNARMTALGLRPGSIAAPTSSDTTLPSDTAPSRESELNEPVVGGQDRELYNTAYRDLIRGNYELALQGFQQFVTQYPNSELLDNAQYWIGEVYYAQGRYQNAIDEFEKVVKWYRNGDKTASALLKIAYSYINIDEIEQGKLYLEEVLKDFPDSEEANLARGRLESLN